MIIIIVFIAIVIIIIAIIIITIIMVCSWLCLLLTYPCTGSGPVMGLVLYSFYVNKWD